MTKTTHTVTLDRVGPVVQWAQRALCSEHHPARLTKAIVLAHRGEIHGGG